MNTLAAAKDAVASNPETQPSIPEEGFRLAAKLRGHLRDGAHVIQLTGVGPGDGVTRVAGLLAAALTRLEPQSVLLIDANSRRPALHSEFGVSMTPGLADVILDRADFDRAVQATAVPGLFLLPAGVSEPDVSLFTSPCWRDLLHTAQRRFSYVVIDSAPILHYTHSALIAQSVNAVVVVMRAGERRRAELVQVKRLLEQLKANLTGVVLSQSHGAVNA